MNSLLVTLWISDNAGACLGLILNSILLLAILKTSDNSTRTSSYLFLTSALFDMLFSLTELAVQHQLLIKGGMFLVMPHGIEAYSASWTYPFIMAQHAALVLHCIHILPALCHYRYKLITSGAAMSPVLILRNIGCASAASAFLGAFMGLAAYQASLRGYLHYLPYVTPEWFAEDGTTPFRYVCDMRDWATLAFFYGGSVSSSISIYLAGNYTVLAWKAVNTQHSSERTKELQRQFSRSLIAQTINAGIFAIFPVSLTTLAMQLGLNFDMVGTIVMSPLSWLPSANALLTIFLIKAYRRYVLRLVNIKSLRVGGGSIKTWKTSTVDNGHSGPHSTSRTHDV